MTHYKNRCIYRTGTSGTGSLVLGELLDGTFFPLSEDDDGKAYNYVLTEGNAACEYGTGVYDHVSGTLTREVTQSTNEDAPIELSGEGAVLAIGDVSAADLDMLLRRGDDATGLNSTAADTVISPGRSTGSASPASVVIQSTTAGSSGTAAQTLVDTLTIVADRVGVRTAEPTHRLTVNGGVYASGRSGCGMNPDSYAAIWVSAVPTGGPDWSAGYFRQLMSTATQPTLVIRNNSSAPSLSIQSNDGTEQSVVTADGSFGVGTNSPQSQLHVAPKDATTKGLIIQGSAAQTANLLEVQDSAGDTAAYVTSQGGIYARFLRTTEPTYTGSANLISARNNRHGIRMQSGVYGPGNVGLDAFRSASDVNMMYLSIHDIVTLQIDRDTTPGNTRLLLYDVDSGQLQRVKVGPDGSGPGGAGRALFIDNTED